MDTKTFRAALEDFQIVGKIIRKSGTHRATIVVNKALVDVLVIQGVWHARAQVNERGHACSGADPKKVILAAWPF